ncbi:hypothetical protein [Sphingomonas sp. Root710]|uniref:hypothetical protein n=1 Tax=Sphingomonas sp. Root710 TaxID=1736594 RepID=UPI000B1D8FE8|nr:hypothetical protein [Sphingomonas sp. Root710]
MSKSTQKTCFVISAIGPEGSEIRERADLVYDFVIAKVLEAEPFSFKVERADRIGTPGIITNQIIDRVINSDLVVADLTGQNPNVFYELAIRHISQKPFIHLISDTSDIPFDNAAVRAIPIDVTNLRSVEAAKRDLAAQAQAAMADKVIIDSPISIALNLQDMKKSGDREQIAISTLAADVADIKRSLATLSLDNHASSLSKGLASRYLENNHLLEPENKAGFFGKITNKELFVDALLQEALKVKSDDALGIGSAAAKIKVGAAVKSGQSSK